MTGNEQNLCFWPRWGLTDDRSSLSVNKHSVTRWNAMHLHFSHFVLECSWKSLEQCWFLTGLGWGQHQHKHTPWQTGHWLISNMMTWSFCGPSHSAGLICNYTTTHSDWEAGTNLGCSLIISLGLDHFQIWEYANYTQCSSVYLSIVAHKASEASFLCTIRDV